MSKVYVAGKTHDYMMVRAVQSHFRMWGWEITHDWTRIVQEVGGAANEVGVPVEKQVEFAAADMKGVYTASLVAVVASQDPRRSLCGTYIEMGMALAWNIPVWLIGRFHQESVFFELPHCTRLPTMNDLYSNLETIGPVGKLLEQGIAKPAAVKREGIGE